MMMFMINCSNFFNNMSELVVRILHEVRVFDEVDRREVGRVPASVPKERAATSDGFSSIDPCLMDAWAEKFRHSI